MLIIKIQPLENGAHKNLAGGNLTVPEGWIEVPRELEVEAMSHLPFIVLQIEDGALTSVEPNIEAWEAWMAEQEPEGKEAQYKTLVQQYIHSGIPGSEPLVFYTLDDELALANEDNAAIRNNEESSQEYLEYRAYVDECKEKARAEVYGEQTSDEGV